MSFQKVKIDSYCVRGRHPSSTKNIYGDIISEGSKVLLSYCSNCNKKKSMVVSDNFIQAEALGSFLKKIWEGFRLKLVKS